MHDTDYIRYQLCTIPIMYDTNNMYDTKYVQETIKI